MRTLGLGIVLLALGLLLTFSPAFGFPLEGVFLFLGVVLVVAGMVLGVADVVRGRDEPQAGRRAP